MDGWMEDTVVAKGGCVFTEEGRGVGGGEAQKRREHEVCSWKRQRGVEA